MPEPPCKSPRNDRANKVEDARSKSRAKEPIGLGERRGLTLEQLRPVADHLVGHLVEDCGHIIPLHRPERLLGLLEPFLGGPQPSKPSAPSTPSAVSSMGSEACSSRSQ